MRNLRKHIQNTNAREHLWLRGDTIVLGVSGGADSMCLLHLFASLAKKEDLSLIVAHVNYGLREQASDRDEKHVHNWAHKLGLSYEVLRVSKNKKQHSENVWRKTRYTFFNRIATKYDAHAIAVAHNKNDQAETLLMNLFRGSGPEGLRGMPYKRDLIIRPLLAVERKDIVAYCKKQHVRYYNDSTNTDTTFTRNRLRHVTLPHIAQNYNPNIVHTLSHTATLLAQEYTSTCAEHPFVWAYAHDKTSLTCSHKAFVDLSTQKQRHVLREAMHLLTKSTHKHAFGTIEECRKALLSTKNKTQTIHVNGLKLQHKGGIVKFTCKHTDN